MEFTGRLSVGVSKGAIHDNFKAVGLSNQMNGQSGLLEATSHPLYLAESLVHSFLFPLLLPHSNSHHSSQGFLQRPLTANQHNC